MFNKGIYQVQLTVIAILLVIMAAMMAFKPSPSSNQSQDQRGYSYDDEMRENMKDYQLQIQDNGNKVVLYDGNHIVHVFDRAYKGNKNFFDVLDRDNW